MTKLSAIGKLESVSIRDHLREHRVFQHRVLAAGFILFLLVALLIARMVYLQVVSHEHFTTQSRENRVKLLPLPPTRGLVVDRNNVLLAQNLPSFSLSITPELVENTEETVAELGAIIPITDADLRRFDRLMKQRRRFDKVPIRVQLSEAEAARFAVQRHRFPGVDIEANLLRNYPLGELTAHAVGYVGRINEQETKEIDASNYSGTHYIGKIGVEKSYEDVLHGRVGLQQVEVNAKGRVLRILESEAPESGHSLVMFLELELQRVALDALGEYNGAVVAIEPATGGVLALVSKPGYDPNLFVEGISMEDYNALQSSPDKPLFNRALRGQYPPGSTVKPFMALAGLETGEISAEQRKYCPGYFQLPGQTHKYRDWKRTGHGFMNMRNSIVQSCDVYYYDLAKNLGIERMDEYLDHFRFGRKTGIDLVGERQALLPSPEWKQRRHKSSWYVGETLIAGIGQGFFLATPLQLAAATAAVANRGVYMAPRMAYALRPPGSRQANEQVSTERVQIPVRDPLHWRQVIDAMADVVESARGTARRIRTSAYRIAGKTGTAQVFTVKQDEKYDESKIDFRMRDHALFVAFAPIEEPRIAVAVLVENGGHGGAVAAPIARRVLDQYLLGTSAPVGGPTEDGD